MKWALQRDVFGKKLMQQPVIRFKFGQMIAEVPLWFFLTLTCCLLYCHHHSYFVALLLACSLCACSHLSRVLYQSRCRLPHSFVHTLIHTSFSYSLLSRRVGDQCG